MPFRPLGKVIAGRAVRIHRYSRAEIKQCFAPRGAQSKDEIAREIAKTIPEFAPLVPPLRRAWAKETHRMGLFDAIALVFTYYHFKMLSLGR